VRSGSLVRRRQLARTLRELRVHAGLTIEAAAPLLDFSASKLSRIENAHQGVDVHIVRSMLDLFDVRGDQWGEILDLTREASTKGWWRAYGLDDKGYVPLEAEASTVRDFTVTYVPGLLQTADYARALFEAALRRRSSQVMERDVTVRMIRQERLASADRPLELFAVIEEAALRRPVGGTPLMRAQLTRLVKAGRRPRHGDRPGAPSRHRSTRRNRRGLHGAQLRGLGEPDTAYVEYPMGAAHVDKAEDVTLARLVFDHLRTVALSPTESVELIERVAAQM
jgi:transcriptional regulator with XRE-family HTH domain